MAANENGMNRKDPGRKFERLILSDRDGRKYTLEFNSRVVKNMERSGFKIDTDYPMTMIEKLFVGAFQMHHKGMTPDAIMEIWKYQRKKDDLLGRLTELYLRPIEDMMDEEKTEEDDGTPTWEAL